MVERVGGERRRQGCRSDSQGQRSAAVAAAKRAGDGGSGRSHAIDEEARHAGSDQPFVTLMNQLLTQRAIEYDEEFPRKTACIDIFRQKSTELSFH